MTAFRSDPNDPAVPPSGAPGSTSPSVDQLSAVAPALAHFTHSTLQGELWHRPDLSPRDRSVVTVAALIARNQLAELQPHFDRALEHGVESGELSEIITHLAFYAGWPNALAAATVAREVFASHRIPAGQLPPVAPTLRPIDQAAEDRRAATVQETVGRVSPGLVHYTGELLFRNLWLRPGLAPRDRSLVTVSALIATGQVAQVTFHLNRAMDNGLRPCEVSEVLTHLAFYAGWPSAMSAVPAVKAVLESRPVAEAAL